MEGAFVEFRSVADTTFTRRTKSMPDGKFTATNLPYGDYTVEVSFMGYETYNSKVTVNMRNLTISAFYMTQSSLRAEDAVVMGQMIRVSMHGDTIIYNPKAFDVAEDADAEAIIRQLPGVEVQDGVVTVQGKTVSKILVDDKETYGTDVQETMKTIPAEMLDKIEVYQKLSDFAETTGIDDGDDYTVMNFVTGIKFAHFGEASGMYGEDDKYAAGARWNIVTGSHRFGINAGANNTGSNSSQMSNAGMMGSGSYGRQTMVGSGGSANAKTKNMNSGLTYHFEPTQKFRFNTNYRYGKSDNERIAASETRYYNNSAYGYDHVFNNSENGSEYDNHNFGMSSRWQIDNRNNVNMRLNGSFSDSKSTYAGEQKYFEDAINELVQHYSSNNRSSSGSHSLSGQLNYGIKIGQKNRSARVGINGSMSKNDGNSRSNSHWIRNMAATPPLDSLGLSRTTTDYDRKSLNWNAEYFEPLSQYTHLSVRYNGSYNYSDRDSRSLRWDYPYTFGSPDFDLGEWAEWGSGSGVMNERNYRHEIAPGINFRKNNNQFRVHLGYENIQLNGESVLPQLWKDKKTFNGIAFNVEYERQLTPHKSIIYEAGTDTNTPELEDLQGIDQISNSGMRVSGGNPGLKVSPNYWTMITYRTYNLRKASSFSVWLNGHIDLQTIGTERYGISENMAGWDAEKGGWLSPNGTWLTAGQQYSRPINLDKASWNIVSGASYGQPLKFIKSNFNTGFSATYSERAGLVNGEENTARNQYYNLRANLNSNFSEDLIIGLSYQVAAGWTDNSNKNYSNDKSFSHGGSMNFYWLTWKNFVLRANATYSNMLNKQSGFADDYRFENLMANVSIGKKLFKNRRGEISFAVNDLFNQNNYNYYSNSIESATYTNDRGLGRYYSISFRYQLRNFTRDGMRERRNGRQRNM